LGLEDREPTAAYHRRVFATERGESGSPARGRARRLLSRTFSRARWHEYVRLLKAALSAGYEPISLERFLDGAVPESGRPLLILRHDVDQDPRSAITMANIEADFGLRSTWYFRWRTAHPAVIAAVRRRGAEIGLHYETLSRDALEHGIPNADELPGRIAAARERLADEIATFKRLFGPIRSVAPHGDTRVPGVRNADLLLSQDCAGFGIVHDANSSIRRHSLAAWLTDRSSAEGGWGAGIDPFALRRHPLAGRAFRRR
jgi:hypothetical protein